MFREGEELTSCPVCGMRLPAPARTFDYRNRSLVTCRRCGNFEIAWRVFMTMRELTRGKRVAEARLSYQIRLHANVNPMLILNSSDIAGWLELPLPDPRQQIRNLVKYLAAEVGDDHSRDIVFGPEDYDELAAIVGTVGGEGVQKTIEEARTRGFITIRADDDGVYIIALTAAAFDFLNPPEENERPLEHEAKESLRVERQRPLWVRDLREPLRALLEEMYLAVQCGLLAAPFMLARAAFDCAFASQVGDLGNFKCKLAAMKRDGHLDDRSVRIISSMIDAGHASAHRGHVPDPQTVSTVVEEVQHLIWNLFVREKAAAAVKSATPPRPKQGGASAV